MNESPEIAFMIDKQRKLYLKKCFYINGAIVKIERYKKIDLIRLLIKYLKESGEYKYALKDLLNLDVSVYLNRSKEYFINKPTRRGKIKHKLDYFNLSFDSNEFNPIKEKKYLQNSI